MITINLLPEDMRIRESNLHPLTLLRIPIGIGICLALLTAFLYVDFIFSKVKLRQLESRWSQVEPGQKQLKTIQDEVEKNYKPEQEFLNQYVTTDRPMTYLLNWANEYLPETAWLTELKVDRLNGGDSFFVKGYTLNSKTKSGIEQIELYMKALKEKLPALELKLMTTRQKIENFEVTEFIANFETPAMKK